MTREQLQQIRTIVYDAYCEGDTEAEWMLVVIDAELAKPEPEHAATIMRFPAGDYTIVKAKLTLPAYELPDGTLLYTAPVDTPQQPVSMETVYDTIIEWSTAGKGSRRELARRMIALFAAPQREWQGLTAEQVNDVRRRFATNISVPYFVMIYTAIEAALKEKNHG